MKVIYDKDKQKVPIKMWLDDLEEGAMEQALNLSNLPFIFKHVALMPDCHQGYGMPIGGVITTQGVVVPNAVGVDIGCFTGDTEVISLDGSRYTMEYMAHTREKFCVYSCTKKGRIVARYAIATKTRTNANLCSVTIDNGEVIRCTPDHQFMMRDGTYKEAKDICKNDSLMPLYTQEDKEGYLRVMQPNSEKWQRVHWMVARSGLLGPIPFYDNDQVIIHHKKFQEDNGLKNNHPDSLAFMASREHSKFHREIGNSFKDMNADPKFQMKRLAGIERIKKDPKKRQQMKDVGTRNIIKYMNENREEFLQKVSDNGKRGAKYLKDYNTSEKGRQKSSEVAHIIHICPECGEECEGGFGLYNHIQRCHPTPSICKSCGRKFKSEKAVSVHQRYCKVNHKVKSVEFLDKKADAYCLQIQDLDGLDNPHNFALAAGVFVHNCGMTASKTSILSSELDIDDLKNIMSGMRRQIPVGFSHHKQPQEWDGFYNAPDIPIVQQEIESAQYQLGTLGGGNHFLEVQKGDDGYIWVMIHSGSRNFGYKIAKEYHSKAVALCEKFYSNIPDKDLSFLPLDIREADEYLKAMEFALDFAYANRRRMMKRIEEILHNVKKATISEPINIHHNYAAMEHHFGTNVFIHRKGATSARDGQIGIIPGSQGTKSYIVRGKGNPESFMSCSHGAGRCLGRKAAQENLNLKEEQKRLDDLGILHSIRNKDDLEEAASAYKDIGIVMENQKDLVEIEIELSPLGVVKG